ncbi:MAG: outer membrane beta-barrel protein [Gammaproteobacteria bacterium]|nr:outer membrane beta-barrel protein [Gammaproteobacteria bacterium]
MRMYLPTISFSLRITFLFALFMAAEYIRAADSDTPAPLQESGEEAELGGFKYSPNASLSYEYNDNIYATDTGAVSDTTLRASVGGAMMSRWKQHAVEAGASVNAAYFNDYSSENTTDYQVHTSGRYDFNKRSNLFGGLSYSRLHEARGSIEAVSGDEPTIYYKGQANAGIKLGADKVSLTLAGNASNLDYRNTPAAGSVLFNDDRDRNEFALGARLNYALAGKRYLFAQLRTDVRDYKLRFDEAGYERSSTGYRAGVGYGVDLGTRLKAEVMLGYLTQNYDDVAFNDVNAFDYKASLNWYVSKDSNLQLELSHALEETTLPGSPGYLYRQFSMQWRQRHSASVFAKYAFSYGQADYQQSAIKDDYYDASVGIAYALHKGILAGVDLRHLQRDSNQVGDDFARNVLSVSVSGRF